MKKKEKESIANGAQTTISNGTSGQEENLGQGQGYGSQQQVQVYNGGNGGLRPETIGQTRQSVHNFGNIMPVKSDSQTYLRDLNGHINSNPNYDSNTYTNGRDPPNGNFAHGQTLSNSGSKQSSVSRVYSAKNQNDPNNNSEFVGNFFIL
jgi:hypothetical protein